MCSIVPLDEYKPRQKSVFSLEIEIVQEKEAQRRRLDRVLGAARPTLHYVPFCSREP
jgi:hypothetical protein